MSLRRSLPVSLAQVRNRNNKSKTNKVQLSLSSPSSSASASGSRSSNTSSGSRSITVVSLLSPCPEASRRASQRIAQWTGWKPVVMTDNEDNSSSNNNNNISSSWNQVLINNALFTYSQTWHSRALQCPSTGTVLHWISLQKGNNAPSTSSAAVSSSSTAVSAAAAAASTHPHQLLAIQQAENLTVARDFLAKTIQETSSTTKMALNSILLNRPIQAKHLLSSSSSSCPGGSLPLLQFIDESSSSSNNSNLETRQFALKEIAISDHHHHDDDESSNNSNMTLLQRLSKSLVLSRPVTGLYQIPGGCGVCLRPLPTGRQDWQVSPPSLVFHVDSLASIFDLLNNKEDDTNDITKKNDDQQAVSITKIGYSGMKNRPGQLMLRHADLNGIDVRFCQATAYSSMFAEAQESLLAGSLQELQSDHHHHHDNENNAQGKSSVVNQGTKTGHCWVEFHANMRNPSGFIAKAKQGSMSKLLRRAKPPNLPFE